jgi:hypothetical protein
VCSVRKYLPSDGTGIAVGLEVPFDEGEHTLHVMVCEVGETGHVEAVLFETTKTCRKEAAPARGPLPRLQYSDADSLALCGVDVPATVEQGRMRVIVALKRTWHDAPTQVCSDMHRPPALLFLLLVCLLCKNSHRRPSACFSSPFLPAAAAVPVPCSACFG